MTRKGMPTEKCFRPYLNEMVPSDSDYVVTFQGWPIAKINDYWTAQHYAFCWNLDPEFNPSFPVPTFAAQPTWPDGTKPRV